MSSADTLLATIDPRADGYHWHISRGVQQIATGLAYLHSDAVTAVVNAMKRELTRERWGW